MSDMQRYVTVVIQLPEEAAARRSCVADFRLGEKYKEGIVTAMSLGDVISEVERLEGLMERLGAADE